MKFKYLLYYTLATVVISYVAFLFLKPFDVSKYDVKDSELNK